MTLSHLLATVTLYLGQVPTPVPLHFASPLGNLGELRSHQVYQHSFTFTNNGSQPLEILTVEPSCGCLGASLDRPSYKPGQTGKLTFEVKPASQPDGPHSWFAKVRFACGDQAGEVRVQMNATIRRDVVVQPTILAVTGAGQSDHEVVVTDRRGMPLKITRVQFSSALAQPSVASSDKGTTRIVLRTTKLPPGRHDETLSIFTDDPMYDHFQVPVTLTGVSSPQITTIPERITLRAEPGRPVPATLLRIRAVGDMAVTLTKVVCNDPAIRCTWASGPGNDATVRVQVDSAKLGDRRLDTILRVHTTAEELIVPIRQE